MSETDGTEWDGDWEIWEAGEEGGAHRQLPRESFEMEVDRLFAETAERFLSDVADQLTSPRAHIASTSRERQLISSGDG